MRTTRRKKMVRRTFTDAQRRQHCRAWKQAQKNGSTFKAFCKKIKVSENTVRNWLKKFNMALPSGSRSNARATTRRNVSTVGRKNTKFNRSTRKTAKKNSSRKSTAKKNTKSATAKRKTQSKSTARKRSNARTSARRTTSSRSKARRR